MTEDGGVAESLNVQLNDSEIAPSFIPEDVTKKLGLPEDLQTEKVFVHKTANYENFIIVRYGDDGIGEIDYVNTGGIEKIVALNRQEQVIDATSVGNTFVITTSSRIHYMLYVDNKYKYLGNNVPVPHIEFQSISNYRAKGLINQQILVRTENVSDPAINPINLFDVDIWNNVLEERKKGNTSSYSARLKEVEEELWTNIRKEVKKMQEEQFFVAPFFVRYAVRLYDGSYINHSVPILLGSGFEEFVTIEGHKTSYSSLLHTYIGYKLENIFETTACLKEWNTAGWEDIIESVDIFASTNVYIPLLDAKFKSISLTSSSESAVSSYTYAIEFDYGNKDILTATEDELVSKGVFYKIGSFPRNDDTLQKGWKLNEVQALKSETDLVLTEDRLDDTIVNDEIIPGNVTNYNNRLLATSGQVLVPRGYSFLNATNIAIGNNKKSQNKLFTPRFSIKGAKETVVLGKYYDGSYDYQTYEMNTSDEGGPSVSQATTYGFLAHPDPNCYKVNIWVPGEDVYSIPMKAHPRLNCSYAFWGLSNTLEDFQAGADVNKQDFIEVEDRIKEQNTKVYAYDSSNPFVVDQSYSFQSKVIGLSVATTALSQGQFGQFPLYVFTQDGIWVMETAADGSFVTSKPLSRDVCVNPDSITPLDNAVVFVTAQGVMMLQGSQVVNISPNMNGRHYQIENSARTIIENQDFFCDLLSTISDKTHFLAFVKSASVAYDYAGKRLIFIKDDETYEYVYKLDTQTWHKTAYGINLVAPINSYPECLVQAKRNVGIKTRKVLRVIHNISQEEREYLAARLRVKLPGLRGEIIDNFLDMTDIIDVTDLSQSDIDWIVDEMRTLNVIIQEEEQTETIENTRVYDLSTLLDAQESGIPARGIIATRPFDLGEPDILKTITDIRIRGQFPKGAVKFILLGSNDGINFATVSTLRGRAWKLFRMVILADLAPTERISWVDIMYDTKFTNKLR